MFDSKGMFFCVFFGLCVYFAMLIIDYLNEKRDKQSEPAQVHLYACAITAFALAMLTALFSMVAMMLLGIHGGYWLTGTVLALVPGYMLVKHIFEKVLPETMGETRPISGVIYSLIASAMTLLMLMIFWGISVVTGIAVQYDSLPFKI